MGRLHIATILALLPVLAWAEGSGKFSIETKPKSLIIVDDIPVRSSPLGNLNLPAGRHKFEYRLDSGKTEEFFLTISAGKHLICNYNFETSMHPCKQVDLKPVKVTDGSFEAKSSLPAEVKLDGKPIGKTPITKRKVSLGKHKLEFRSGDIDPVIREFYVNANEHVEVDVNFEIQKVPVSQ